MLSLASSLAFPMPDQDIGSPAILRLRLLEARIAARRPMDEDARRHAALLIESLRRAIAERPCLSFAELDAPIDELRKALLKGALAGLAHVEPRR